MATAEGLATGRDSSSYRTYETPTGTKLVVEDSITSADLARIVTSANTRALMSNESCVIDCLAETPSVKAYQLTLGTCEVVVKQHAPDRLVTCSDQTMAEAKTSMLLLMHKGGHHPFIGLPIATELLPKQGSVTTSLYAGPSLDIMIGPGGAWEHLDMPQRLYLARRLAACLLLALKVIEGMPAELGGGRMHRDLKPSNICCKQLADGTFIFLLMDFGGCCAKSFHDYFNIYDLSCIDNIMAMVFGPDGRPALESAQGLHWATRFSLDYHQLGQTILQLLLGGWPAVIDPKNHTSLEDYLAARARFNWGVYALRLGLPPDVPEFINWLTNLDPACRPQSAVEALTHEFVFEAAEEMEGVAKAAAGPWKDAHDDVCNRLAGSSWCLEPCTPPSANGISSSGSVGSTAAAAAATKPQEVHGSDGSKTTTLMIGNKSSRSNSGSGAAEEPGTPLAASCGSPFKQGSSGDGGSGSGDGGAATGSNSLAPEAGSCAVFTASGAEGAGGSSSGGGSSNTTTTSIYNTSTGKSSSSAAQEPGTPFAASCGRPFKQGSSGGANGSGGGSGSGDGGAAAGSNSLAPEAGSCAVFTASGAEGAGGSSSGGGSGSSSGSGAATGPGTPHAAIYSSPFKRGGTGDGSSSSAGTAAGSTTIVLVAGSSAAHVATGVADGGDRSRGSSNNGSSSGFYGGSGGGGAAAADYVAAAAAAAVADMQQQERCSLPFLPVQSWATGADAGGCFNNNDKEAGIAAAARSITSATTNSSSSRSDSPPPLVYPASCYNFSSTGPHCLFATRSSSGTAAGTNSSMHLAGPGVADGHSCTNISIRSDSPPMLVEDCPLAAAIPYWLFSNDAIPSLGTSSSSSGGLSRGIGGGGGGSDDGTGSSSMPSSLPGGSGAGGAVPAQLAVLDKRSQHEPPHYAAQVVRGAAGGPPLALAGSIGHAGGTSSSTSSTAGFTSNSSSHTQSAKASSRVVQTVFKKMALAAAVTLAAVGRRPTF